MIRMQYCKFSLLSFHDIIILLQVTPVIHIFDTCILAVIVGLQH